MKIHIQQQERELLLQTVSLIKNNIDPANLYLFRCPYCSNSTGVQIQGNVYQIEAGLMPTEDVVTIHQCKGCKRLYTFQTLAFSNKRETRVTLIATPQTIGIYHCWLCRNPLLQFMDNKIVKLPDFKLMQMPFEVPCVNPSCIVRYKIVDVV